jgi:hypothetical protein
VFSLKKNKINILKELIRKYASLFEVVKTISLLDEIIATIIIAVLITVIDVLKEYPINNSP